ncbi:MAG: VWA domain-containing protein [Candidatus Bathyarchaeia archaeon]
MVDNLKCLLLIIVLILGTMFTYPTFSKDTLGTIKTALEKLKSEIYDKIRLDVDNVAGAFTQVVEYDRAAKLYHIFRPIHWAFIKGITTVDALVSGLRKLTTGQLTEEAKQSLALKGLSLLFLWHGIEEQGNKLALGISGYQYVETVERMLKEAEAVLFPFSFDSNAYKQAIKAYLYDKDKTPVLVPLRDASGKVISIVRGPMEACNAMLRRVNDLISKIEKDGLPPEVSEAEIILAIDQLKKKITTIGKVSLPTGQEISLGMIYKCLTAMKIYLDAIINRLTVEQYLVLTETAHGTIALFRLGGTGKYKEEFTLALSLPSLSVSSATLSAALYERVDPERAFYEMPQVMLFNLSLELANLWRLIDQEVSRLEKIIYKTGKAQSSAQPFLQSITASVLVMDVSGSMSQQWKGGIKIESAKKAALQFLEQVANEPRPVGTTHMISVVTFSSDAQVVCPLTADHTQVRKTIISLGTLASTNMGAGLDAALKELDKVPQAKRFIILLSDGMTNTGKSREQILATSVAEARTKGICIHTVGFGDPGDIDEDFLKKIALQSNCGTYNYASTGFELFGTYIKVRHAMLGSNRIVDFSSGPQPVRMLPGQTATLGAFQLTAPAKELHFTLAWSEPGRMNVVLVDPTNQKVTSSYPGAQIYSGNGFVHVTVFSPKTGIWRASAIALSSFVSGVQYYGVASARTGGFVIPYSLPIPCFDIAGTQICIPLPDMPTVLIVIGSVVFLCWVIYTRLTSP